MRGGPPGRFVRDRAQHERLQAAAERTASRPLQDALRGGVGFHHAAMDAQDRALVEACFLDRSILARGLLSAGLPLAMRGRVFMHDRHRSGLEATPHPGAACTCLIVTSHARSLHARKQLMPARL
jgi:hypothetical protein